MQILNKNFINFCKTPLFLLFTLFSCYGDNGCIDADNFGDIEIEKIEILSANESNCDIGISKKTFVSKDETDTTYSIYDSISNVDLKNCLKGNETRYTNADGTLFKLEKACATYTDANLKIACEINCVNKCKSDKSAPRWVTNNPSGTGFGNGVSILPNSIIEVTITGEVNLGLPSNGLARHNLCVKGNDDSKFYSSSSGVCSSTITKPNILPNTSYIAQFDNIKYDSSSYIDKNQIALMHSAISKLFLLYKKKSSINDNISNWSCDSSLFQTDATKISCKDPNNLINTIESSRKFDKYIGFIRANDNNFNIREEVPNKRENILYLKNLSKFDKYFQIKIDDANCSNFIINKLEVGLIGDDYILDPNNTYYRIENFSLNSSYFPSNLKNVITFYSDSTIKITLDNDQAVRTSSSSTRCVDLIKIRTSEFLDIVAPESGFAEFSILPTLTTSGSCTINGRIINSLGAKTLITDSSYINQIFSSAPSQSQNQLYQKGIFVYNNINKNLILKSETCIPTTNLINSLNSISDPLNCNNGNGQSSTLITNSGGGGGNIGGSENKNGTSFYNPEFHESSPNSISYDSSQDYGKGGINGENGNNGSVLIYTENGSGIPTIISNIQSSRGEETVTINKTSIPAIGGKNILKYKINGGGGGGSSCFNNGSNGDYFSGSLNLTEFFNNSASVDSFVLYLKAGTKGNGTRTCNIKSSSASIQIDNLEAFEFIDFSPNIIYKNNYDIIFDTNPYCQSNNLLTQIYSNIFASSGNSGSINPANYAPLCSNGSGGNGFDGTNGGGGSGGGNGTEIGGGANISGVKTHNSKTGKSYYNPEFHDQKPIITLSTFNNGSVMLSNPNNVTLYNNFSPSSNASYIIPSNYEFESLQYQICGGKGGSGANSSANNLGSGGACITGILKNIKAGLTLNFSIGEMGGNGSQCSALNTECGGSNSSQTATHLRGGNGGKSSSNGFGGGAGGTATVIYTTIDNEKKIIAIAGGGQGAYGGASNSLISSSSISDLDLLPYLQIKNDDLFNLFLTAKYFKGDSKLETIGNKQFVITSALNYTINAPTNYKISKFLFFSFGSPYTIGDNYIINKNCHFIISTLNHQSCLDSQSCTINNESFDINQKCNQSQLNKSVPASSTGNGGGGGNISGSYGLSNNPGESGSSFYNKYYHSSPPKFLSNTDINPSIIIDFKNSSNNSISNHNISFATTPPDLTIPANTRYIEYTITGEKGDGSVSGTGTYGTKLTGIIDKITNFNGSLKFFSISGGIGSTGKNNGGRGIGIKHQDNIIVIAGGSGGAGTTLDPSLNQEISDELSYFIDKKLAVKVEYTKNPVAVSYLYPTEITGTSVNLGPTTLTSGASNEVINDIIYAGYGEYSASSPAYFNFTDCTSKDVIERIKTLCIGKNSCSFTINESTLGTISSNSSLCSGISSIKFKVVFSSISPHKIINEDLNSIKLKGGNGSINGNGGAGGSASYIKLTRIDEAHDNSRTDYLVIASGGSGGSNILLTDPYLRSHLLENNSLGFKVYTQTKNSTPSVTSPDLMHYYEYDDNITPANSTDPMDQISVNSSGYSQPFYIRKNQILRIYPSSFQSNFLTTDNKQKNCTVGTVLKITPRPAVMCFDTPTQSKIENPLCKPKILVSYTGVDPKTGLTSTASPSPSSTGNLGCQADYNCADINNGSLTFCPIPSCSEPSCTFNEATDSHSCGIVSTSGSACTDVASPPTYNETTCQACQVAKKNELEAESSKITISNTPKCYSFENSKKISVNKFLNSKGINFIPPNSSYNAFTADELSNFDIDEATSYKVDESANVNFGNLLDYKIETGLNVNGTPYKIYSSKNSLTFGSNGELEGFIAKKTLFKDLNKINPSNSGNYEFQIDLTRDFKYRNGGNLEIVLCKESSSSSLDCKATGDIPAQNVISKIISSPVSSSNPHKIESAKIVYNADFSPASLNCSETLYSSIGNKNFLCYNLDSNNDEEIKKHRIAFKIKDENANLLDNKGKYTAEIKVKQISRTSSGSLVESILNPILLYLDGDPNNPNEKGMVLSFYQVLISTPYYQRILNLALMLGLSFYGVGYLIGVNELKHSEILKIILKMGIIYLFTFPALGLAWFEIFFVKLFKDGVNFLSFIVASTFDSSTELKNKIISGDFSDKKILFKSVDNVLGLMISSAVQNKIAALIFSSVFGWVYFVIIFYCILIYFYAIANSVLLFITCQIMLSIIMILGPIFFIFLIFKVTKDMFDNWIKALIGFGLQQIFLILTLAFFNNLVISFLKLALGYRVCWTNILKLNLVFTKIALFNFWTVAGTNAPTAYEEMEPNESFGNDQNMPSLYLFLMLLIIVSLMKKFIEFFTNLAVSIAGGLKASTVGGEAAQMGKDIFKMAKSAAGKLYETTAGRVVDNADNFLFASGKIAKQQKIAERKQFMENAKTRATLMSEGSNAVSEYKKNNAMELSSMSKSEQKEKLESVRMNAIKEYAKDNGIKNLDKIMDTKGLSYSGTNLFGAAFQAGKQATMKGGALFNSMNDKAQASTSFSKDEAVAAMKNMNKQERDQFIKNIEEGNIHVNKGAIEKMRTPIKTIKSALTSVKDSAKGVGSSAKKTLINDSIKNQAIKELEDQGKITRYKAYTPLNNWARNDSEKKLIRDKMREIAKDKNIKDVKDNKATSSSVIRDLKIQGNNMDREVSVKNKLTYAGERVLNVINKAEINKDDKKIIQSEQTEKNKRSEIEKIDKQLFGDRSNPQEPKAGLIENKERLEQNVKSINRVLNDNNEFKRYTNAEKLHNSIKENSISGELKDSIRNGNDEDLKRILNKVENLYENKPENTSRGVVDSVKKAAESVINPIKKLALESTAKSALESIMKGEKETNQNLNNYLNARELHRGELNETIDKIDRLENRKKILSE